MRQIRALFEGGHLFTGRDPVLRTYKSRAHLAEMISLLGPPPPNFLARGRLTHKFFSNKGKCDQILVPVHNNTIDTSACLGDFSTDISIPTRTTLGQRESRLEGEDKALFLRLMMKMLQWEPEKRTSVAELAYDEWICKHI